MAPPRKGDFSEVEQRLLDAVTKGNTEEVKALLKDGNCKIDFLDDSGMTLLQHAAFRGKVELCEIFLARGADVNSNYHENGYTALMFAALSGNTEVTRMMLNAGAKIDHVNSVGRTAAQMAGFVGQHQCVSVINSFFPKEKLLHFTKPQGLEKEAKLTTETANALLKMMNTANLHPVKLSYMLQDNPCLMENSLNVIRVLENLCEKFMKVKDTNDIMAMKTHYFSVVIKHATKVYKDKGGLEPWLKSLLKQREDGCEENQEKLIRQCLREFPYGDSQLFQQIVGNLARVKIGDQPTGLSILSQGINGQKFTFDVDTPCHTCGDSKAEKKCSACKMVNYCNARCQKLHWGTHKKQCKSLAEEYRIEEEKKRKEEEKKRKEKEKQEQLAIQKKLEATNLQNGEMTQKIIAALKEKRLKEEKLKNISKIENTTPVNVIEAGNDQVVMSEKVVSPVEKAPKVKPKIAEKPKLFIGEPKTVEDNLSSEKFRVTPEKPKIAAKPKIPGKKPKLSERPKVPPNKPKPSAEKSKSSKTKLLLGKPKTSGVGPTGKSPPVPIKPILKKRAPTQQEKEAEIPSDLSYKVKDQPIPRFPCDDVSNKEITPVKAEKKETETLKEVELVKQPSEGVAEKCIDDIIKQKDLREVEKLEEVKAKSETQKVEITGKPQANVKTDAEISRPLFVSSLTDKEVEEGMELKFEVAFSGTPTPTVAWYLDDEEIKQNPEVRIITKAGLSMLLIRECIPEDEGEYTVEVTNKNGCVSASAFVAVLDTPYVETEDVIDISTEASDLRDIAPENIQESRLVVNVNIRCLEDLKKLTEIMKRKHLKEISVEESQECGMSQTALLELGEESIREMFDDGLLHVALQEDNGLSYSRYLQVLGCEEWLHEYMSLEGLDQLSFDDSVEDREILMQDETSYEAAQQNEMHNEGSPQDELYLEGSPQDGMFHEGSPQNEMFHECLAQYGMFYDGSPQEGTSHENSPQNVMFHEWSLQDGMFYEGAPEGGMSGEGSPQNEMFHEDSQQDGISHEDSQQIGISHEGSPQEGRFNEYSPLNEIFHERLPQDRMFCEGLSQDGKSIKCSPQPGIPLKSSSRDEMLYEGPLQNEISVQDSSLDGMLHECSRDGMSGEGSLQDEMSNEVSPQDGASFKGSPLEKVHEGSPQVRIYHEGSTQDKISHEGSSQDVMSHKGSPKDVRSYSSPQDGISHEGSPQDVLSYEGSSQDVVSHEGSPQDQRSHEGLPQDIISYEGSSQNIRSHEGSPQVRIYHEGSTQDGISHEGSSQNIRSHEGSSKDVMSCEGSSQNIRSHEGSSKDVMSCEGSSQMVMASERLPQDGMVIEDSSQDEMSLPQDRLSSEGSPHIVMLHEGLNMSNEELKQEQFCEDVDFPLELSPQDESCYKGSPVEKLAYEGSPVDGSSNEGSAVNGLSHEGLRVDESSNESLLVDGLSFEGSSVDGLMYKGSSVERLLYEGSSVNGLSNEGSLQNLSHQYLLKTQFSNTVLHADVLKREGLPEDELQQEGLLEEELSHEGLTEDELSQEGLPEDGLSQEGLPEDGLSQEGLPEDGLSQEWLPGDGLSQEGLPGDGLSLEGLPEDTLPREWLPEDELSQKGLPEDGLSQEGLPEDGLSQEGLPEDGLSQEGLPEDGLSQEGLPEDGLSQEWLPGDGLSQEGLPGDGLSLEGLPEDTLPREWLPEDELSQKGLPEDGLSQEGLPEDGLSQEGLPEDALLQKGLPEDGLSQEGLLEDGFSQEGLPEDGFSQEGLPDDRLLQKGLPENGLLQEGLPEDGLSQEGLPEDALLQKGLPEDGLSQEGLLEDRLFQEGLPKDTLPREWLPKDEWSEERLPEDTLIQEGLPEDGFSQEGLPDDRLLQKGLPEDGLLQEGLPEDTLIQEGLPEDGLLQEGLPEDGLLQEGLPEYGLSQERLPEDRLLQEGLPEDGLLQEGLPEDGLSQERLPEDRLLQEGLPEDGLSQEGLPEDGLSQEGLPENGLSQEGLPKDGLSQKRLPEDGFQEKRLVEEGLSQEQLPDDMFSEDALQQEQFSEDGLPQEGLSKEGFSEEELPEKAMPNNELSKEENQTKISPQNLENKTLLPEELQETKMSHPRIFEELKEKTSLLPGNLHGMSDHVENRKDAVNLCNWSDTACYERFRGYKSNNSFNQADSKKSDLMKVTEHGGNVKTDMQLHYVDTELDTCEWEQTMLDAITKLESISAGSEASLDENLVQQTENFMPVSVSHLCDMFVNEGTRVEMEVKFYGIPEPRVAWFIEDEEIRRCEDIEIITENGHSTLVIKETVADDEGEYCVEVTNGFDSVSSTAYLSVLDIFEDSDNSSENMELGISHDSPVIIIGDGTSTPKSEKSSESSNGFYDNDDNIYSDEDENYFAGDSARLSSIMVQEELSEDYETTNCIQHSLHEDYTSRQHDNQDSSNEFNECHDLFSQKFIQQMDSEQISHCDEVLYGLNEKYECRDMNASSTFSYGNLDMQSQDDFLFKNLTIHNSILNCKEEDSGKGVSQRIEAVSDIGGDKELEESFQDNDVIIADFKIVSQTDKMGTTDVKIMQESHVATPEIKTKLPDHVKGPADVKRKPAHNVIETTEKNIECEDIKFPDEHIVYGDEMLNNNDCTETDHVILSDHELLMESTAMETFTIRKDKELLKCVESTSSKEHTHVSGNYAELEIGQVARDCPSGDENVYSSEEEDDTSDEAKESLLETTDVFRHCVAERERKKKKKSKQDLSGYAARCSKIKNITSPIDTIKEEDLWRQEYSNFEDKLDPPRSPLVFQMDSEFLEEESLTERKQEDVEFRRKTAPMIPSKFASIDEEQEDIKEKYSENVDKQELSSLSPAQDDSPVLKDLAHSIVNKQCIETVETNKDVVSISENKDSKQTEEIETAQKDSINEQSTSESDSSELRMAATENGLELQDNVEQSLEGAAEGLLYKNDHLLDTTEIAERMTNKKSEQEILAVVRDRNKNQSVNNTEDLVASFDKYEVSDKETIENTAVVLENVKSTQDSLQIDMLDTASDLQENEVPTIPSQMFQKSNENVASDFKQTEALTISTTMQETQIPQNTNNVITSDFKQTETSLLPTGVQEAEIPQNANDDNVSNLKQIEDQAISIKLQEKLIPQNTSNDTTSDVEQLESPITQSPVKEQIPQNIANDTTSDFEQLESPLIESPMKEAPIPLNISKDTTSDFEQLQPPVTQSTVFPQNTSTDTTSDFEQLETLVTRSPVKEEQIPQKISEDTASDFELRESPSTPSPIKEIQMPQNISEDTTSDFELRKSPSIPSPIKEIQMPQNISEDTTSDFEQLKPPVTQSPIKEEQIPQNIAKDTTSDFEKTESHLIQSEVKEAQIPQNTVENVSNLKQIETQTTSTKVRSQNTTKDMTSNSEQTKAIKDVPKVLKKKTPSSLIKNKWQEIEKKVIQIGKQQEPNKKPQKKAEKNALENSERKLPQKGVGNTSPRLTKDRPEEPGKTQTRKGIKDVPKEIEKKALLKDDKGSPKIQQKGFERGLEKKSSPKAAKNIFPPKLKATSEEVERKVFSSGAKDATPISLKDASSKLLKNETKKLEKVLPPTDQSVRPGKSLKEVAKEDEIKTTVKVNGKKPEGLFNKKSQEGLVSRKSLDTSEKTPLKSQKDLNNGNGRKTSPGVIAKKFPKTLELKKRAEDVKDFSKSNTSVLLSKANVSKLGAKIDPISKDDKQVPGRIPGKRYSPEQSLKSKSPSDNKVSPVLKAKLKEGTPTKQMEKKPSSVLEKSPVTPSKPLPDKGLPGNEAKPTSPAPSKNKLPGVLASKFPFLARKSQEHDKKVPQKNTSLELVSKKSKGSVTPESPKDTKAKFHPVVQTPPQETLKGKQQKSQEDPESQNVEKKSPKGQAKSDKRMKLEEKFGAAYEKNAKSTVEAKVPVSVSSLSDKTVEKGSSVKLEVTFSGVPLPNVTWYLDGDKITSMDGITVVTRDGISSVTIGDCISDDEGDYCVEIENQNGKVSTTAYLGVS